MISTQQRSPVSSPESRRALHRAALCILLAVLITPSAGCLVWKSDYEALRLEALRTRDEMQATIDTQNQAISDRDVRIRELEKSLAEAQLGYDTANQNSQSMQAALTRAETYSQTLQARLDELEGRIATLARDRMKLATSVEEMQLAMRELQRRKAEAEGRINEYRDLLTRFRGLIDSGKLRVKIVDGRMVVELATDVLFPSGRAELSDEGLQAIAEVTEVLVDIPNKKYQIEGHTDNVPISKRFASNWELASARSLTVVKFMVTKGMPANRISASSYAETRPVKPNDDPDGRAANRRIEIVVVPDLSTLPGFDELEKMSDER